MKQYETTYLQLNIGDYTFVSQFTVVSLWSNEVDILLGSPWMETLGSFILNTKNKFLTFSYKKKKITLQDIKLDLDPVMLVCLKNLNQNLLT
jgi:hypothetical protein